MGAYRKLQVGGLIQQELGRLLLREFDFEGALVTITDVAVSRDLLQAEISLGVIPRERGPEILDILEKRRRGLERLILKKINIKPMPRFKFLLD